MELGPYIFKTKKAAYDKLKEIKEVAIPGIALQGDDAAFLWACLKQHPRAAEKRVDEVDAIMVTSERGNTRNCRCFKAVLRDGTVVDWSPYKTIDAYGRDPKAVKLAHHRKDVVCAFRSAVLRQTKRVKEAYLRDNPRATRFDVHVDHAGDMSFARLMEEFLVHQNIDYRKIKLVDLGNDMALANPNLACRWRCWHKTYATLEVITAEENLTKPDVFRVNWELLETFQQHNKEEADAAHRDEANGADADPQP
jgi:hypothetical protein